MLSTATIRRIKELTKTVQHEVSVKGDVFCTDCGLPADQRRSICENCGSTAIPCEAAEQVVVSLNAHELRTLCHLAEKWAKAHNKGAGVVYSIINRLRDQLPSKKMLPTIESELEDDTTNLRNSSG